MSAVIESAVNWAVKIANDNSHGYDQSSRWGPNYDCSSLVISAFEQAGCKVKSGGATYTGNMKSVFLRYGFSDVTSKIALSTGMGLKRGDVLLNTKSHTALVVEDGGKTIVNASINENGKTTGGRSGDQTGREIYTRGYYNYPWDVVLRYTVEGRKRRVAAYARVSTDSDEQFTSFEAQVDYYTRYIAEHSEWLFVKVYADEGISGTSTKHRVGFNEMIEDALAGKIDLIVTKSISRFARNTIDTLTTVRQLKEKGIEVFFEKENIYTLDSKGELLITIMSSIAQEESRSISENVTWGQRKRFADGKVSLPYKNFLGYKRGKDGKPQIVESEAKIVRRIYRLFLDGLTPTHIARTLTEDGIPTPGGKVKWQNSTVESILTNEKYKGDALLQKKYTVDFLSKKQKINEGEVPQYYVEGSHEGIVTAEVFDLVQYELQRRKNLDNRYNSTSPFSSRLICGDCGGTYGAKIWDSNSKYRREIYRCNHRYGRRSGSGLGCKTPHLTADEIKTAFIGAFNSCIKNRKEIIDNCVIAISEILDTSKLEKQAAELSEECAVVTELIRKCVDENAHISVDPKVYAEKYELLADRYAKAKDKLDETETEIANRNSRKNMIVAFLYKLEKQEHLITDFDTGLWNAVIESMTIYSKEHIVFKFKGGTEIKWSIV